MASDVLRSFEHRIESLFEGVFGRAFRSHVQPVELARKLVKEMDSGKTVSVSRIYVPNEYHLYLSPKDREQFRGYEDGLLKELADYLAEHARREGYSLPSRPRILLHEDDDLAVGEFGIATRLVQPPQEERPPSAPTPGVPLVAAISAPATAPVSTDPGGTQVFEPQAPSAMPATEGAAPDHTVLVIGDARHQVEKRVLTLGRSKDCDIVVDDPSVSRQHAELRREDSGYTLVDLGSTNGTEVNGKRIDQAPLEPGDRITLGQTEARFERA